MVEVPLERLADAALGLPGADGVEVVVHRRTAGLTRFANSQVHQNVWTSDVRVDVRVVADGGRVSVVGVTTEDPAEVAAAARRALATARLAPADDDFPGLSGAAAVTTVPVDEATAGASPADRADAVRTVLAEVPPGHDAAGAYETAGEERGVFTSAGQAAIAAHSSAALSVVVTGPTASGWAESGGRAMTAVDPAAAGRRAAAKAVAGGRGLLEVDPGMWPVVLEPAAVATLVEFLAYLGFGGRAWLEGRAFTSGRLGERVLDPAVTIVDDATAPQTLGWPFDHEGTPARRVDLVRDGVLTAVVHDRATAATAGTTSTGHAQPAPSTDGPLAAHPLLLPGSDGSVDDLVAGCERALLVTRFHYTNVVRPMEAVLTGMTRDGTFLVRDGRIAGAVRNLRYTQSALEALARVEAVSTETGFGSDVFAGARCPAVRLPAFDFTSATTFG